MYKTKLVFLSVVVAVLCVIAGNFFSVSWVPLYETLDSNDVYGGKCYSFTVRQCTGGTLDCTGYVCSSNDGGQNWLCNANTVTVKTNGTYTIDCPEVEESGWPSCVPMKLECSQTKISSATCSINTSTGIYYCSGSAGTPQSNKVDHYYPENGESSSC
jgi:hypothetical protein